MVEILYKSKNAVVIYKPHGIPTQSDLSGDEDALSITARMLGDMGESTRLWPVHRLDRAVGGVVVFARSKAAAAALSEIVKDRQITKEYLAVVEGEAESGILRDLLRKDARSGRAYVTDSGCAGAKEAVLEYRTLAVAQTERGARSLVSITLHTGRFHQIRAQFSSRGMPIVGDGKYGSKDARARQIALFATHISLALGGERIEVSQLPDATEYPWNLFDI